jgi:outer membrane protein TolC
MPRPRQSHWFSGDRSLLLVMTFTSCMALCGCATSGRDGAVASRSLRMTRIPLESETPAIRRNDRGVASPARGISEANKTAVEQELADSTASQVVIPTAAIVDVDAPAEVVVAEVLDAEDTDAAVTVAEITDPEVTVAEAEPTEATSAAPSPSPAAASSGQVLSLNNVLYLAEGQNPNVAIARERIQEAYARVDRADVLWLPSIRAGLNYHHHDGRIQDVAGTVIETSRSAFYGGLGAGAVGAGSPSQPGLVAQFHLTDAIFQPKIAEHQAASRQFNAAAVRNDVLRDAAVAYLELLRAEQGVAIAREAVEKTETLTNLTRQFADSGQGLRSDYQRMQAELALRQDALLSATERTQTAAARLAQILHADPALGFQSGEPLVMPLAILPHDGTAASFVATGLQRRPELAEQKHLVCEAVERLQREKYAPLIPSVLLGMSYGGQGGGLGSSIINSGDRWDADAMAYWEVRNLGLGEKAARAEMASLSRQAQQREVALMDRVAREAAEAHAQVTQRQQRIPTTQTGIAAAEQSYTLNVQRIENAQGLPIEALQSITALAAARQAYLNAVIDYNIAQFELCRAIGWFAES